MRVLNWIFIGGALSAVISAVEYAGAAAGLWHAAPPTYLSGAAGELFAAYFFISCTKDLR